MTEPIELTAEETELILRLRKMKSKGIVICVDKNAAAGAVQALSRDLPYAVSVFSNVVNGALIRELAKLKEEADEVNALNFAAMNKQEVH